MTTKRHTLVLTLTAALALGAACGGSDGTDTTGGGGQGASGGGGADGGAGGTGGGGEVICEPGETRACYEGPEGTEAVGLCQSGTETCADDGSAWGECSDQVVPADEDCDNADDDDCDGIACAEPSWAVALEGMGDVEVLDLAVDANDNSVVVGTVSGELIVDATTVSDNQSGVFVAKLDPNGDLLWLKVVAASQRELPAVTTDATGAIYVAGHYAIEPINFGDSPATELEAAGFEPELFAAKLDANGNHVWSRFLSSHVAPGVFGPEGSKRVRDIVVDGAYVYISGYYNGHFGGVCLNGCPTSDGVDGFVRGLNANTGATIFQRRIHTLGNDSVESMDVVPGGGIYVAGRAGPNPLAVGTIGVPTNGAVDPFVARLDETGNLVWGVSLGGATGEGWVHSIVATANGVAVSGHFVSELELGQTLTPPNANVQGGFVGELSSDGTALWGLAYGGDGDVIATNLAVDSQGQLLLSTWFKMSGAIGDASYQTVGDAQGGMLTKLDPTGAPLWSRAYLTASTENTWIEGLAVTSDDHVHIGIFTEDAVDMGLPMPYGGGWDGIVARIQP